MKVTGHFDDPAAATCRAIPDPSVPPELGLDKKDVAAVTEALRVKCANRFVATALREVAPPSSALWFCPAGDPIPVAAILDARASLPLLERVCFGGGDVTISGWFDPRPQVGLDPSVDPSWLDPSGQPALWPAVEAVLKKAPWLVLFTDPSSGVTLPATAGWYRTTGHFDDPAATGCGRTDPGNVGNSAVDECRSEFVVTGVAPGTP